MKIIIRVEVRPGCGPPTNTEDLIFNVKLVTYWPFLTLLTLYSCWLIFWVDPLSGKCGRLDVLANEPESLFEDYIQQVHRALLNKTLLVYIVAINLWFLRCWTHIVCVDLLFIRGWSNGYFKKMAIILLRCNSFLHAPCTTSSGLVWCWEKITVPNLAAGLQTFCSNFGPRCRNYGVNSL